MHRYLKALASNKSMVAVLLTLTMVAFAITPEERFGRIFSTYPNFKLEFVAEFIEDAPSSTPAQLAQSIQSIRKICIPLLRDERPPHQIFETMTPGERSYSATIAKDLLTDHFNKERLKILLKEDDATSGL